MADSDHEAMVTAAREHYVDDCVNEHGICIAPVVREAILVGTPVAVGEVRRLSLSNDLSSSAAPSRPSPPSLKFVTPTVIPKRRG